MIYQDVQVGKALVRVQLYEDNPSTWLALGYFDGEPILERDRGKRAVLQKWTATARARFAPAEASPTSADSLPDDSEWTEGDFARAGPASEVLPPDAAAALQGRLDDFHWHEALHTANIAAKLFEAHLAEHAVVQADEELKESAERIAAELHDFYQLIGRKRPS